MPRDRTKNRITQPADVSKAKQAGGVAVAAFTLPGLLGTPFAGWSKSKDALDKALTDARAKVGVIATKAQLKVYCDTNTLPGNVEADETEAAALKKLQSDARVKLFSSHIVGHEATRTKDTSKRDTLASEHREREPIPKDEKIVGFNAQWSPNTFIGYFSFSDVQDEALRDELKKRGLKQRDAEHIAQAVSNAFDVFLTRDVQSIIRPHGAWLSKRFPGLKVVRPSELVAELAQASLRAN